MPLNLKGIALEKEEAAWKGVARRLATELLAPDAARIDREGVYPRESLREIGKAGLLGLVVPKDKGGPGGNIKSAALVIEELAQGCASTAVCFTMHLCTVPLITSLARGNQQERFVKPLVAGDMINSFAMSEPGSGNRLWHTDSVAARDGDDYVIDAVKSFATGAGQSDFYLVTTRASPDSGPNDISLFLIDGRDENIQVKGRWDGMGLRGNSSTPVHFKNCRVPPSNRVGPDACGFHKIFAYSLPLYQVGLSSIYLGIAQAAYDAAVAHVRQRVHTDTGVSLSNVETVQRYIADMRLCVDQTRQLVYRAAQMSDNALALFEELDAADLLDEVVRANPNDPFFIDLAQIKVSACQTAIEVTNMAFQVCGGTAYRRGHPVERLYRDARAGSVMAPSDDALKLIIGRQVLGLSQPW